MSRYIDFIAVDKNGQLHQKATRHAGDDAFEGAFVVLSRSMGRGILVRALRTLADELENSESPGKTI